ncbi:MAG: hypothetical protein WBQ25_05730 [Nitrososphaeraceae archaeon]
MPKCHIVTIQELWSGIDDDWRDSDGSAHSICHNNRSSTRVNALESRTSPLTSTATLREHATMTVTVSV